MADAVEIDAANEKLDGQNRIGGLASFFEACKYLDEAKADKTVQVRAGDKHTALCLKSSVVAALVFLVLPFLGLSKYAAYCLSAADFFFTVALTPNFKREIHIVMFHCPLQLPGRGRDFRVIIIYSCLCF